MTGAHDHSSRRAVQPIIWGFAVGAVQAASPFAAR